MAGEPEIFAAVLGAVLGVLGGVIIERVARSWGRLWCEPSGWELNFWADAETNEIGDTARSRLPRDRESDADRIEYSVRLDLFNGKEIPVGLRDARIVIRCAGGTEVVGHPNDLDTGKKIGRPGTLDIVVYDPLSIINLPPRQWVAKELRGTFDEERDIRRLSRWTRAELVGERQRRGLLESKTFRKAIASRPPLPDPWKSESS